MYDDYKYIMFICNKSTFEQYEPSGVSIVYNEIDDKQEKIEWLLEIIKECAKEVGFLQYSLKNK